MANQNIIPLIRDADRGRLVPDMQAAMNDIVAAIEENRGKGKGKITLTLSIESKAEGSYTITPSLAVKVPERARADMATFLDETTGELIRRDPRQPDLPGVAPVDFRSGATDQ